MENKKFGEFVEEVTAKIGEYLPVSFGNCNIEVKTVAKNNGLILTGICVNRENSHIAPVVYLNELFERYQNGCPIGDVLEIIAKRCAESEESKKFFDVGMMSEFETAKSRIRPKLICKEWNEEFLKDKVYTELLDLAVIYQICLDESERGLATVTINKSFLKNWDVSIEEIHQAAVDNMMTQTPCEFKSMMEIMRDITGDPLPDDYLPDVMWVLTNSKKVNGAACLLDKQMLDIIESRIGSFFILPSSVHEVIVLPDNGADTITLRNMVMDVNESQVSIDDRLSDHVYRYDSKNGLSIAE